MLRIGILGYSGRMGQLIADEISHNKKCRLIGGTIRNNKQKIIFPKDVLITDDADIIIKQSDVVVDFTSASSTSYHLKRAVHYGKAFVIGTTGLSPKDLLSLKNAAKKVPVLYAANTSLSLAAMKQLTALAAKLLKGFDYDVAILDEHHREKKDAPSGTAKVLGEAVIEGNQGKKIPHFVSLRAGHIVGEHEVIFAGEGETIRLHHSVNDRRIFARGALEAALWLYKKPKGFYSMDDVLKLAKN